MTLTLRRQSSRFIPEEDRDKFWSVICEETIVGSIVLHTHSHGSPAPWHWSITMFSAASSLTKKDGSEPTRDDAMAAFRRAWDIYRPEIGEEGWRKHLEHCAWMERQDRQSGTGPSETR